MAISKSKWLAIGSRAMCAWSLYSAVHLEVEGAKVRCPGACLSCPFAMATAAKHLPIEGNNANSQSAPCDQTWMNHNGNYGASLLPHSEINFTLSVQRNSTGAAPLGNPFETEFKCALLLSSFPLIPIFRSPSVWIECPLAKAIHRCVQCILQVCIFYS